MRLRARAVCTTAGAEMGVALQRGEGQEAEQRSTTAPPPAVAAQQHCIHSVSREAGSSGAGGRGQTRGGCCRVSCLSSEPMTTCRGRGV